MKAGPDVLQTERLLLRPWEQRDAPALAELLDNIEFYSGTVNIPFPYGIEDALEFIASLRIQHQAEQIRNGQPPDNYVPPSQPADLRRIGVRGNRLRRWGDAILATVAAAGRNPPAVPEPPSAPRPWPTTSTTRATTWCRSCSSGCGRAAQSVAVAPSGAVSR